MKVLVTGGAGFIGSAVVRMLVGELGAGAVVVDKLTYAALPGSLSPVETSPNFAFVKQDICEFDAMVTVFREYQPDAVLHLAAESHVDRSITGSFDFIRTNVAGTHSLLEAARVYWSDLAPARKDAFRLLHVSTDEVYGALDETGAFTELTAYNPSSPYAASKAASDHVAIAWQRTYGLPVLISNCTNNYGPYHFPEKLIPLAILNALEMKAVRVYGDGMHVRDWLHVDDHARALIAILDRGIPGQTYAVGGRNERRNIDVVQAVCDIVDELAGPRDRRGLIEFVTDRPGHDFRYAIDPSKIESELSWRASVNFAAGLRETVAWYLANPGWWQSARNSVYGGERLGLSAGDIPILASKERP